MPGFGITGKRLCANRMESISPGCKVSAGGKSPERVSACFRSALPGRKRAGPVRCQTRCPAAVKCPNAYAGLENGVRRGRRLLPVTSRCALPPPGIRSAAAFRSSLRAKPFSLFFPFHCSTRIEARITLERILNFILTKPDLGRILKSRYFDLRFLNGNDI